MDYQGLRDDQWVIIKSFVPGGRKGKRGPRSDGRKFINALLWLARSGARWRDIPANFGSWQSIKRRYYRWLDAGIIDQIFARLIKEADMEWIQIDSTIIRAHRHAAGAPLKKGAKHPNVWAAPKVDLRQKSMP